ncbi:hypothetical protein [Hoylesella loescheii]|uniref:hypothetical protein n=1 Tax=Hoylesella loescheii TaxID=840 RepID=UPI00248E7245|nr:hypothetical protein [Hoylesella loescheii]
MKKFKLLSMFAIALLVVVTLFASCSSDDDGQEPNTITNNKGTYKVNGASITDLNDQYSITLIAHPGNGVKVTILKTDIGKRIDLSKRGRWKVDSPTVVANGEMETLQSGSYVHVKSYANGQISISYCIKKSDGNGSRMEKGNYSGSIKPFTFQRP